jgi:hypothetical protein
MKADDLIIQTMTAQFKRAAIVYHWGYEDDDDDMRAAGKKSAEQAVAALDTCGTRGRMALVPLLDDPDPSVRVFAAGFLVKVMPERALAALKEVQDRCLTRAHMTAFHFLERHENGNDL